MFKIMVFKIMRISKINSKEGTFGFLWFQFMYLEGGMREVPPWRMGNRCQSSSQEEKRLDWKYTAMKC